MTILNTFPTEITTGTAYYFTWSIACWIGVVIVAIIIGLAVIAIKEGFEYSEGLVILLGITLITLAAVILFALILPHEITTTINTYEVVIDETVSFNEIIDKYNFIEKRGDIYVLQDKLPEGENE
jgi:hypothetical protein